jgi:hypothetical protein
MCHRCFIKRTRLGYPLKSTHFHSSADSECPHLTSTAERSAISSCALICHHLSSCRLDGHSRNRCHGDLAHPRSEIFLGSGFLDDGTGTAGRGSAKCDQEEFHARVTLCVASQFLSLCAHPPIEKSDEREVAHVVYDHHSLLQYGCCEQGFVGGIQKIASHSNFRGGPITDIPYPLVTLRIPWTREFGADIRPVAKGEGRDRANARFAACSVPLRKYMGLHQVATRCWAGNCPRRPAP